MMEFYTSKHSKAKKSHICNLCGKQIQIGESYHRFSGKYDGVMFDLKHCESCEMVIDAYYNETGECEYHDDDIIELLHEKYCIKCPKHIQDDCMEYEITCPTILKKLKGVTLSER